jgi:membrane protease YdiL (CAAX protease family)
VTAGALPRRLPRAALLVLAGLPGVLSLLLVLPQVPGVPRWALLVNPLLLLLVTAFAGTWAARRGGLVLQAGTQGRLAQAGAGIALGLAIAAADHLGRGWWQAAPGVPPSVVEGWSLPALLVGLLYGGVVEEVLFRWGLTSLLLLALWRALARRAAAPPAPVALLAVGLAALAFAASHLPALVAAGTALTTGVVLRTLVLNALAGGIFGWLFLRRDLVAAILAHAGTHLGFALVAALITILA